MIKKSKYILPFLILIISLFLTSGQDIDERKFDDRMMEQYAQDDDFGYMNYTVKPPSIWERIWWSVLNFFDSFFVNPNTASVISIGMYIFLAVVVVGMIYLIVRMKYGSGLNSDPLLYKSRTPELNQTKEEDFDRLITEALEGNNFKLAIRYLYLRTLLNLSKKELIKLKEWKSPYDYEQELKSETAANYKELARLFEYVWYGDFEAGEGEFNKGNELSKRLEGVA